MININIKGLDDVTKMLSELKDNKIHTATRNAVNDTAFGLQNHLRGLVDQVFPGSHPSMKRNIVVKKANKENLQAKVLFDQLYRKGMDEFLLPHIQGGVRKEKPSEFKLGNRFWVPGVGMKLNAYGNAQGSQVLQILSRLGKLEQVAGANQNRTAASRKRGRKAQEYFMLTEPKGGLQPGIYQRVSTGKQLSAAHAKAMTARKNHTAALRKAINAITPRGAMPVMVFTKAPPKYKAKFPFFTSGRQYVLDNLPRNIAKEVQFYIGRGFGR